MKYIKGMKYQLAEDYSVSTPVVGEHVESKWYVLHENGVLDVFSGYCWDGASGPTFDTDSSMKASLVHDVFCLMMRDKVLSYDKWQDTVNAFFRQQCIEDGMWVWRANLWHDAVEFADSGDPNQGPDRKVYEV